MSSLLPFPFFSCAGYSRPKERDLYFLFWPFQSAVRTYNLYPTCPLCSPFLSFPARVTVVQRRATYIFFPDRSRVLLGRIIYTQRVLFAPLSFLFLRGYSRAKESDLYFLDRSWYFFSLFLWREIPSGLLKNGWPEGLCPMNWLAAPAGRVYRIHSVCNNTPTHQISWSASLSLSSLEFLRSPICSPPQAIFSTRFIHNFESSLFSHFVTRVRELMGWCLVSLITFSVRHWFPNLNDTKSNQSDFFISKTKMFIKLCFLYSRVCSQAFVATGELGINVPHNYLRNYAGKNIALVFGVIPPNFWRCISCFILLCPPFFPPARNMHNSYTFGALVFDRKLSKWSWGTRSKGGVIPNYKNML